MWVAWNRLLKLSQYLERKIVLQRFYISSMMSRVEKMSLTPKGPTGLKSIWLQNFRDSGLSFPTHWSIFKESAQNIYQTSDGGRHDFWIINRLQYCFEKCQLLSERSLTIQNLVNVPRTFATSHLVAIKFTFTSMESWSQSGGKMQFGCCK